MSEVLNVSIEYLMTGKHPFDPTVNYIRKYPGIRKIVNDLAHNPEKIIPIQFYLEGRISKEIEID